MTDTTSLGLQGTQNGMMPGSVIPGAQSLPPHPHPHLAPLNTSGAGLPNPLGSPLGDGMLSATSSGGSIRRAAPEPNKQALYVGGLDPRVTEDVLKQIFETTGTVMSVKIIPDKNMQNKGYNYGFIEYEDPSSAERAMQTLNGRSIHQNEIRVNWAYQSTVQRKEDTSGHYHIFVGDLSNEVNDEILLKAFSAFGSVSEARVMWDMKTGRSRGYGFVAFRDKVEADKGVSAMNGEWLGSRQIRCNWANQKGQPSFMPQQGQMPPQQGLLSPIAGLTPISRFHTFNVPQGMPSMASMASMPPMPPHSTLNYQAVLAQTPPSTTTVYVGGLTPYTTQNDLLPLFIGYGYVVETRFQSDRGYAFVKMDTHEHAAAAIVGINGTQVHGRTLKTSWGKDRDQVFNPQNPSNGFAQSPQGYFPQYANGGPMSPTIQAPFSAQAAPSPIGYPQSPLGYAQSPGGYGQSFVGQNYGRMNQFGGAQASPGAYGGNFQGSPHYG